MLTRQNVPTFPRGTDGFATTENVHKGGYMLLDTEGTPDVVLIGTGSEVQLAVEARAKLAEEGVKARVVSMPSREWFDEQDDAYRESVIPAGVRARVSVEAGIALELARASSATPAAVGEPGALRCLGDYQTLYDGVRHHHRRGRAGREGQHRRGRRARWQRACRPDVPPPARSDRPTPRHQLKHRQQNIREEGIGT